MEKTANFLRSMALSVMASAAIPQTTPSSDHAQAGCAGRREQSMIGQNYMRSLFALGFQGFLILICVGIYAVLVRGVALTNDIIGSLWGLVGYTILLAFTLFKTGTIARSVLHAH